MNQSNFKWEILCGGFRGRARRGPPERRNFPLTSVNYKLYKPSHQSFVLGGLIGVVVEKTFT